MPASIARARPRVLIVSPAAASANNGNWHTAARWQRFLAAVADAIERWRAARAAAPIALVLTGTDLYRDIDTDPHAQASLALADRLVVLQECAPQRLPAALRAKCVVSFQSASARVALPKSAGRLRALMVGHLRAEKSPQTYFEAARLLAARADIRLDHIGAALDPALGEAAQRTMVACPHYRWLGGLGHGATRRRIQAAHVLVHASAMEGGAHVVIEAVRSGTPVLASRIDGNVGLLGAGYSGYFDWGDAPGLAALLARSRDDPAMLAGLERQCAARAALFDPAHERRTLLALVADLLETSR
jgi:putative glycosyltransferase (TIGR04348 family)